MKLWRLLLLPLHALSKTARLLWLAIFVLIVGIGVTRGIALNGGEPMVVLSSTALLVLATGWSLFVIAMLWLGRRGWAASQRRPQPFLAD